MIAFPPTRWSLIARLPGAPEQTAAVLGLYSDAIGAYLAAKLVGEAPERVEDVVQEVLLGLLARPEALARAQPGAGSRFRHWLMHLAWQGALDHLRRLRRRDLPALAAEPADPAPAEAGAMDRAWARSLLRQALDEVATASGDGRLPAEAAAVLQAHLIDGEALRVVAERLGLPLATCSRRLAAARRFLAEALAERLRLAGELAADEDPAIAGERLLALLR